MNFLTHSEVFSLFPNYMFCGRQGVKNVPSDERTDAEWAKYEDKRFSLTRRPELRGRSAEQDVSSIPCSLIRCGV